MKKLILSAAIAAFALTTVTAQETQATQFTSKKGEAYLPEAGDLAIQIDAAPILQSVFVGGGYAGFTADNVTNSIAVKYFVDANTAYRLKANLTFGSDKYSEEGYEEKSSGTAVVLGAGIEKRRGKTRLQGVYGAEALVMFGSDKTTYEYDEIPFDGTLVEEKGGSSFGLGVRGFIGAEYFVLPKLSLGFEYGWGLIFSSTGASEEIYEDIDGTTTTDEGGKDSSFGTLTDISNGAFNLTFHF